MSEVRWGGGVEKKMGWDAMIRGDDRENDNNNK